MTIEDVAALEPGNRVILTHIRPVNLEHVGVAPMWVDELWFSTDRTKALVRVRDRAAPKVAELRVWLHPEQVTRPPEHAIWSAERRVWINALGTIVLP